MFVRGYFLVCGLALVLASCGGRAGSGPGDGNGGGDVADAGPNDPCQGENPPDTCPTPCTSDTTCGLGGYCGPNGFCTSDCTFGSDDCGAGMFCDDRGRCQVGEAPPDAGTPGGGNGDACASISVNTAPLIPTVQILIDFSGSMDARLGDTTRVDAVRDALLTPDTGIVPSLQSVVRFGATLYTSEDGFGENNDQVCPILTPVPPGLNNFEAINNTLFGQLNVDSLGTDTPTGESIDALVAEFPEVGPDERRIIVLATDGEPDTCEQPNPQNGQDESEEAAANAFTAGIEIIVLSVGNDVSETHLQRMANIGAGLPANAPENEQATFYQALNPDELVADFNEIIRGTRECKFSTNGEIQDPTEGKVELNGQPLEFGTDWQLAEGDNTTIELIGEACQTYLDAQEANLEAEFTCDSVIIIG